MVLTQCPRCGSALECSTTPGKIWCCSPECGACVVDVDPGGYLPKLDPVGYLSKLDDTHARRAIDESVEGVSDTANGTDRRAKGG